MTGRVMWVVDGDTIHVKVGSRLEKVRDIGVNAPEIPDAPQGWREDGTQGLEGNRRLVIGRVARLDRDVRRRDSYGRLPCRQTR